MFFIFSFSVFMCSKSDFWGASIALRVLVAFHFKNHVFEPSRVVEVPLLRPFSLFSYFSLVFHLFFHFPIFSVFLEKCVSFLFFFSKYLPLLAFVSGFNGRCFLRSRCSIEKWCLDDTGRDRWDWVGPPTWERA